MKPEEMAERAKALLSEIEQRTHEYNVLMNRLYLAGYGMDPMMARHVDDHKYFLPHMDSPTTGSSYISAEVIDLLIARGVQKRKKSKLRLVGGRSRPRKTGTEG